MAAALEQSGGQAALTERNSGSFRFWIDERRFKGRADKCLVQEALFAAGSCIMHFAFGRMRSISRDTAVLCSRVDCSIQLTLQVVFEE